MKILVTGGAGYIGSHVCVSALEAGHEVTIFDNFANSRRDVPSRISGITGRTGCVVEGDIRNAGDIARVFHSVRPDAVVHLAGLKAVGDSFARPLDYFATNVAGTALLLAAMKEHGCRSLVFSSSATVYGSPQELPLPETHPVSPASPYGRSKLQAEWLCEDFGRAESGMAITILRYFNPVGAHPSANIGEDPVGRPNNLMPFLCQVAEGLQPHLEFFGNDYSTRDGTGVRDYLHVCDLAEAHVAALSKTDRSGVVAINLGTGTGASVLELVRAFEQATGVRIKTRVAPRRSGDIAEYYADPSLAERLLGWRATRGLADMCRDAWAWQQGRGAVDAPAAKAVLQPALV